MARVAAADSDLTDYLMGNRWFKGLDDRKPHAIAYFSPEYGIAQALPQYSGGLGILAGDHLKASSDLWRANHRRRPLLPLGLLPAVAVGRWLAAGDVSGTRPRRFAR